MSDDSSPERRVDIQDLNWFGKTVYVGGAALRLAANAVDATARRVSRVAEESKEAFQRELDPNVEEARVLDEYPRQDASSEDDSSR